VASFASPNRTGSQPSAGCEQSGTARSAFAENEEALDIEALKRECEGLFEFRMERHVGSVAYLLVLNSMIFRVPLWLKRIYSPGSCDWKEC